MLQTTTGSAVYKLFNRLRTAFPEIKLTDQDLLLLANTEGAAKTKLLAILFSRCGDPNFTILMDNRRTAQKLETKHNFTKQNKQSNDVKFNAIFSQKLIDKLQGPFKDHPDLHPLSKDGFLIILEILVETLLKTRANAKKVVVDLPGISDSVTLPTVNQIKKQTPFIKPKDHGNDIRRNNIPGKSDLQNYSTVKKSDENGIKLIEDADIVKLSIVKNEKVVKTRSIEDRYTEMKNRCNAELETEALQNNIKFENLQSLYDHITIAEYSQNLKDGHARDKFESFGRRRNAIQASMNFQLKKQVHVLSHSLQRRDDRVYVVAGKIREVAKDLRKFIVEDYITKQDKKCNDKLNDFARILETIYKNIDSSLQERAQAVEYNAFLELRNDFIREGDKLTLLQVSNMDGKSLSISHLNIKKIAYLESELRDLFESLLKLRESLKNCVQPTFAIFRDSIDHVFNECLEKVDLSTNMILDLSSLIPFPAVRSGPTEHIVREDQGNKHPEIPTTAQVIKSFPIADSVKLKIEKNIDTFLGRIGLDREMWKIETSVLRKEVDYHRDNVMVAEVVHEMKSKQNEDLDIIQVIAGPLRELRLDFIELIWEPDKVELYLEKVDKVLNETLAHSLFN